MTATLERPRFGAAFRRETVDNTPRPPTEIERLAMMPRDDHTAFTIQLVISIVGLGDAGDVLAVAETDYIVNLLTNGWAIIYTGPISPTILPLGLALVRLTTAQWTALDPVLTGTQLGVDVDTQVAKIGDDATPWSGLPVLGEGNFLNLPPGGVDGQLLAKSGTGLSWTTALTQAYGDSRYVVIVLESGGTYTIPSDSAVALLIGTTNPEGVARDNDLWIDAAADLLDAAGLLALINDVSSDVHNAIMTMTKPQGVYTVDASRIVPGTDGAVGVFMGAGVGTKQWVIAFPRTTTPGTNEHAYLMITPPQACSQVTVSLRWAGADNGSTGAKTVHWTATLTPIVDGSTTDTNGPTIASVNSDTVGASKPTTIQVGTIACTPGQLYRLMIQRLGANVNDTYVNTAQLIAVVISYS